MKKIEVTAEWILDSLSEGVYTNERGELVFQFDSDYHWGVLATEALREEGVVCDTMESVYSLAGGRGEYIYQEFLFDPQELKKVCPNLTCFKEPYL